MSYVFLAVALLAGAAKGYCGKKTSGIAEGYKDSMLINTVRMLWCILIGFVLTLAGGGIGAFALNAKSAWIILLSGVSSSMFVVSWLICIKQGAYMLIDVFLMLGTVIPLVGSALFLDEGIGIRRWIGLSVLVVACIIMCSYNNSIKKKITFSSLALLVLCGIACGCSDFSQKLFVTLAEGGSVAAFNFYTYVISAVLLFACYGMASLKKNKEEKSTVFKQLIGFKPIFWYVLVMAVCLFANSYFQTKAAEGIPSVQLYPMSKSIALALSSIMAAVFFKEKLTVKCIVGLAVAFIGLLIVNL